ncbi:BRO-N domain-containing protein [Pseudomonas aeruginosa]|uniref:BRO-N domain-containing protein n=1 Tax=Pseudomonas aeruginosa TaxID=287 RepID=UPI003D2E13CB
MCHRRLRTRLSHCRPTGAVSRLFSAGDFGSRQATACWPNTHERPVSLPRRRSQAADSSEKDFSYARPYPACPRTTSSDSSDCCARLLIDDQAWFVLDDFARLIEHSQPEQMLARLDDDQARRESLRSERGEDQAQWLISESGAYAALIYQQRGDGGRIAPLAQRRGGAGVAQRHRRQRYAALRQVALGAPGGAHARLAGQALGEFQRDARPPRNARATHGATGLATLGCASCGRSRRAATCSSQGLHSSTRLRRKPEPDQQVEQAAQRAVTLDHAAGQPVGGTRPSIE